METAGAHSAPKKQWREQHTKRMWIWIGISAMKCWREIYPSKAVHTEMSKCTLKVRVRFPPSMPFEPELDLQATQISALWADPSGADPGVHAWVQAHSQKVLSLSAHMVSCALAILFWVLVQGALPALLPHLSFVSSKMQDANELKLEYFVGGKWSGTSSKSVTTRWSGVVS